MIKKELKHAQAEAHKYVTRRRKASGFKAIRPNVREVIVPPTPERTALRAAFAEAEAAYNGNACGSSLKTYLAARSALDAYIARRARARGGAL